MLKPKGVYRFGYPSNMKTWKIRWLVGGSRLIRRLDPIPPPLEIFDV